MDSRILEVLSNLKGSVILKSLFLSAWKLSDPKLTPIQEERACFCKDTVCFALILSSIPCSAHPDPAALGPLHAQSIPSCQHPEHYTGSSSTGCNFCFPRSSSPCLPLQPCIQSGYPQLCQPRTVSPRALSRLSSHCGLPVRLHCPCLQQESTWSAHWDLSHHGMQEFLKWEITKETHYLLERKAWQIQEFFGGTPLSERRQTSQRQQHSCRICNDQGISVTLPAVRKYSPLTSNAAFCTRAYHCCAKPWATRSKGGLCKPKLMD